MQPTSELIREFVAFFVVIDPIGCTTIFIAATQQLPAETHKWVAIRSVVTAGAVLLFFLVAGQFLLEAMGISFVSFRIAGGIVLFVFALMMFFGRAKPPVEIGGNPDHREVAIFPVAMPGIAGPGAILTTVVLTDNNRFSYTEQAVTYGLLLIVLLITLVLLLMAGRAHRAIGTAGASVVSRIMGIVLAAVAVHTVLDALVTMGVSLDLQHH